MENMVIKEQAISGNEIKKEVNVLYCQKCGYIYDRWPKYMKHKSPTMIVSCIKCGALYKVTTSTEEEYNERFGK